MSLFSRFLCFQYLILSLVLIRGVRSDCYYPDGQNATDYNYVPCKTNTQFSSCCIPSEGDVCLSNGLCYYNSDSDPYPYRGACTDPTFKHDACAKWCVLNNPTSYEALTSCGGTSWCCSDTSDCCSKPNLVFDIGVPSVINAYTNTASFTTLSLQPTTGQLTIITAAATGSNAVATGTVGSATTTDTSSAATSTSAAKSGVSKGLIIGIAAGLVVILFIAIAAGIVLCCVLKARKRRQQKLAASAPMNLIDMQSQPHNPQQDDTSSTANLVYKPTPEKQGWADPAPAYTPTVSQYQQPVGPQGQNIFELQSPIVRPNQPGGPVYHEMHG